MERCMMYVGIACVDGTCPYGIGTCEDCDNCFYYKGCEDCALNGTIYCCKTSTTENKFEKG